MRVRGPAALPARLTVLLLAAAGAAALPSREARAVGPADLARAFGAAVERVNQAHAQKPGKAREADLHKRLPREGRQALERLLGAPAGPGLEEALVAAGEAALDLDLSGEFERIRARLDAVAPEGAAKLGRVVSRERFLVRGLGGLDAPYLERFADVLEKILGAYDEVFGFAEWSKVPGKKLRVRVHLEETITSPPHFAPQHPYHSEVDFPVADGGGFRSPTPDGKFLFYGLCHELGHVIAMWGDPKSEEDHHAWAHYTGVVIVEHLSKAPEAAGLLKDLRDVRWRSETLERKALEGKAPSVAGREGVLALLFAVQDAVGTKAIGAAYNRLDASGKLRRVHRVRYASLAGFRAALEAGASAEDRRAIARIFAGAAAAK